MRVTRNDTESHRKGRRKASGEVAARSSQRQMLGWLRVIASGAKQSLRGTGD